LRDGYFGQPLAIVMKESSPEDPFALAPPVLQPFAYPTGHSSTRPTWHWVLLILGGVFLAGIAFIILVHIVLFGAILFQAMGKTEEQVSSSKTAQFLPYGSNHGKQPALPPPLPVTQEPSAAERSAPDQRPPNSAPPSDARREILWHIIVSGDSYWSIAKQYGVSMRAIQEANPDVKPTLLGIGHRLKLPPDARFEPIPKPSFPDAKTIGDASSNRPAAKPRIRPEKNKLPKLNNIPGIRRYQYINPARPKRGNRQAANGHFRKAYHLHTLSQLQAAINDYQKALADDPSFQQAHQNIALANHQLGQAAKALPSYEIALAINPLSKECRLGFATALNAAKFHIDAANEYQTLLANHPNFASGHLALANLYSEKLKMPDRAKAHYHKGLALNPTHPQAPEIHEWLFKHP
jgi:LysM repeat protein